MFCVLPFRFYAKIMPMEKDHRKALFLYTDDSGHGQVVAHLAQMIARLEEHFPRLETKRTYSMEEGAKLAREACGNYEVLIFSGGDGTFNNIVSALLDQENPPVLGYINGGTISDIGQNFGVKGNYRRALRIIEEGHTCGFDVGEVGGHYFTYMAAVGAFADISYVTKRKYKRRLGRIAYYTRAVGEALKPTRVHCHIKADGVDYDVNTPFILCLSGRNVGGFRVNSRKSSIHDGKFELYLTKPGLFNGLLHYLFFKMRTTKIEAADIDIQVDHPLPWCLDGEAGPIGDVHIKARDSKLRVFCAKKYAEPAD